MMFSLPSKTFLVGEYGVLARGGALLFNTHPCFEFKDGQFFDPHQHKGGFGASSAKWLFQHLSVCYNDKWELLTKGLNQKLALKLQTEYQKTYAHASQDQILPSGVDMLSQCVGQVAYIDVAQGIFQSKLWPFKGLDLLIIPTGNKTFTYQHLKNGIDIKACRCLAQKAQKAIEAFCDIREKDFLMALEDFDNVLEQFGLCCQQTMDIKKQIRKTFPSVFVKGCGALGMDTLLIICQPDLLSDINNFLKEKNILKNKSKFWEQNNMRVKDLSQGFQEV